MAAAVQVNNNDNQMMNRGNNMIPIDRNHQEQRQQRRSLGLVVSSMMALSTLLSSISLSFCSPGNNIDDDDIEEINNNENVRANNNQANGRAQQQQQQQEREIVYCCSGCSSLIADHKELVSRNFRGRNGQAFFFNKAVNVKFGKSEERDFLTGRYSVRNVSCAECESILGWYYERAEEPTQHYKVGKYVLERGQLIKENMSGDDGR